MTKVLLKKGGLLFAAAMALCAFSIPSVAGAASWGVVGSHHVLDSPNFGFRSHNAGGIDSACSSSSFTFRVINAGDAQISGVSLVNCTWSGPLIGDCTATTFPTNQPWTATAVTTSNIQIHGIDIDLTFEQPTGGGFCNASFAGQRLRLTGTLTGGVWSGNGVGQHEILLDNELGLVTHSAIFSSNQPVTTRGTVRDTQQTLTVT